MKIEHKKSDYVSDWQPNAEFYADFLGDKELDYGDIVELTYPNGKKESLQVTMDWPDEDDNEDDNIVHGYACVFITHNGYIMPAILLGETEFDLRLVEKYDGG